MNGDREMERIVDWDEERVSELIASLGFPFYDAQLREHGITGEILVHLDHEALKDIGIHSVGQRLAILKAVYNLKLDHNVPIEDGHYVPPSDELDDSNPFESAIGPAASKHLHELISERDDRIRNLESEVQRLYDSIMLLQSDLLPRPATKSGTASTASRTPVLKSPTSSLFPHPLSNTATLSRNGSIVTSTSRPNTAGLLPDSPKSPIGSPRIPADAEGSADGASRLVLASSTPALQHMISQDFSASALTHNGASVNAGGLTPTTPTLGQYVDGSTTAASSSSALASSSNTLVSSSSSKPTSSSGDRDTKNTPDNPYRSFRVTLEDPCYKVLPAALKKYKINDDWRQYALFICYGNTERCLAYDEKPLILFQKLKESNANPVFMLRHIKDIKSPITVSAAKHAARREKRAPNAGIGLDKPPTTARDGSPLPMIRNTRLHHPPVLLPVGKDKEDGPSSTVNEEGDLRSPASPRGDAPVGYCVAIYPYLAEREEEYDVNVGDTFVIINKTKGWWVVRRDAFHHHSSRSNAASSSSSTTTAERNRCGWVPAGCLLETHVPPLSLVTDPSQISGTSTMPNAAGVPIDPQYVVSVSTPGVALMDYAKVGADELDVKKGTPLRIFKRYNHWSYAIRDDGRRGWLPSWFCGKAPGSTSTSGTATAAISGGGAGSSSSRPPPTGMSESALSPSTPTLLTAGSSASNTNIMTRPHTSS